ncbi:hypothetical protein ELH41_16225 [Rhizobium ruizarguesonis]|jgi:hypothetical protein|uniref:hypothetical protein n=1 Tax=Rhizobium ruizarguesonis TaxID=2081791 RepID=UPI0010326A9E|nr:hypothetical protein [Rhizobium ruizarguesonis]TBB88276.1 hypothetical protein ELH41_16225 [Rhizobium ruizarguesonis]
MQSHPCFECVLPDCDERSSACLLKRAYSEPYRYRSAGLPVPDEVRQRASMAHHELYALKSRANRSEREARNGSV